jgi:DNA adenine methylase
MAHVADAAPQAFLKWPGGKRWLAPLVVKYLGASRARYIEPFLGGGAAFFALRPRQAVLSDSNVELIECFEVVRDHPEELIARLDRLPTTEATYMRMRQTAPRITITRAVRTLYLNRLAFNGIYRVNRAGKFNVPYGKRPETRVCRPELLRRCSAALQGAQLRVADFRQALAATRTTERVYLDPPYTAAHNDNGFRRYNEAIFSWEDQIDLAGWVRSFAGNGGRVVVSNAWHREVRDLYRDPSLVCVRVERRSAMAATTRARGTRSELVVLSRSLVDR